MSQQLFVSAVTVGEIQAGIEITREQDEAKADELEGRLDKVLVSYGVLATDYERRRHDSGDGDCAPADGRYPERE